MTTENGAGVCPRCPRGCPLDAPGCLRGEIYAQSLDSGAGPEPGADLDAGPLGPREHDHLQERSPGPHPHGHGAPPPPPPHGHGPHGRGAKPLPPEPEPDRDSLTGLMRRCVHILVHRSGISGTRERVLRLLAERGDMSQSDFVYLLELRSASVSELLGKLEAQGLVTRRRSETDRRGVTISLADAGRTALPAPADPDAAFSALTDEERTQLQTLLQKLLTSWEKPRE